MMRAWENRSDCQVIDEPFYAVYLAETGIDHPGRDEILQSQPTDWSDVANALISPPVGPSSIVYQKHMAHHLLPTMGRDWLSAIDHAFLIREPEQTVASYVKRRGTVTPADIGLDVQAEIYRSVEGGGPVIDSGDVLKNPEGMLEALCDALDVPFEPAMLNWPQGPRDTDGIWAKYWYDAVEASTGFGPYRSEKVDLPSDLQKVADSCRPAYEFLKARRLQP